MTNPLVQSSTQLESLSPREREVCGLIAEGALHKQIASRLGISVRTVHTHAYRAAAKLPGLGLPSKKIARFHFLFQASDSAA